MISKENGEHYVWGGDCDGWHLVKRQDMSVIHERMPPAREEIRHYHEKSRQFFFVLSGVLTLEVEGEENPLQSGQGLEIAPHIPHQAKNVSAEPVEFLVISCPTTRGDRVSAP